MILLRAFLRRDRWLLLWFVVGITLLYWAQAPGVESTYTTQRAFDQAAATMADNTAFIAMVGPARALNTVGGQVAWQASAFGAILAGLMSMFLVGRHTRAEEESGRDELIRAGVVPRTLTTSTAFVVVLVANALLAAGVAASLVAYGLAAEGAVVLGVGLAGCGVAFGGIALLAAQLTSSTRATYGLTGAALGLSYLLRAIGDVSGGGLSWLSPIGWYQGMRAYSGDRWWPLLLLVALTAVTVGGAYAVFQRRDFGSGLWATRPGPARAERGLRSDLGLAWRLHRGSFLGWAGGMLLGGIAYGSIGDDVGALMGDSQVVREMYGLSPSDLVDSFYATSLMMMVLIGAAFTVSSALRPRAEEEQGRLEPLLGTALPRARWLLSHALVTALGTTALALLLGLGMGVGFGLVTDDWSRVDQLTAAALAYLPGALVLGAVGRLLFGWVPQWARLAWLGLLFCAVVLLFGQVLNFPTWVVDLSPFSHLGTYPAADVPWASLWAVVGVAAVLAAVGFVGFRRRDLRT